MVNNRIYYAYAKLAWSFYYVLRSVIVALVFYAAPNFRPLDVLITAIRYKNKTQ